jgi:ribose/xylose/arabinose/galactoside ABC-type transport system permease subunit
MKYTITSEQKRKTLINYEIGIVIGLMFGFIFGMFVAGVQISVFWTTLIGCLITLGFAVLHTYLSEWSVPLEERDGEKEIEEVEA